MGGIIGVNKKLGFFVFYFIVGTDKGAGDRSIQKFRKGMVIEIFLLYLFYLILIGIDVYQKFMQEADPKTQKQGDDGQVNRQIENQQQEKQNQLILNVKREKLESRFPYFLINHTICAGFAICWSPYEYQIIACYLHMLLFIAYLFCEVKFEKEENKQIIKKIIYSLMSLFNISFIFSALVELGNLRDEKIR